MLILLDKKMPEVAKEKLAAYGEIVEFATDGITYEAISGHPDIFLCPTPAGLIVAPNLPDYYFSILDQKNIPYLKGSLPVGRTYPESARYNSLVTKQYIIQNPAICDPEIRNSNKEPERIVTKQGYIQCNLVALPNNTFITSDRGIEKSLKLLKLEVLYVDPTSIKLDGFEYGFFGGACGLLGNTFFICGSLKYFKEHVVIEEFIGSAEIKIIELYSGPLLDVGTIMFLI